jgi:hypothetical protein
MKTRHEIEEITQHPDLVAAAAELRIAAALKDELVDARNNSPRDYIAYELAATQWARAYNKFEQLIRDALV